jgi:hypothetical protein
MSTKYLTDSELREYVILPVGAPSVLLHIDFDFILFKKADVVVDSLPSFF